MSDLGAIFHVKKAGVQYDAHAYTTLDECPYPNLKIKFKGQQGYVKLRNPGEGDVPCYTKPKSEDMIYQVRKEAAPPTGEKRISASATFTVPMGITVLEIEYDTNVCNNEYVGVTPGSTHKITIDANEGTDYSPYAVIVYCATHSECWGVFILWDEPDDSVIIRWSPEINKKSPTITDY